MLAHPTLDQLNALGLYGLAKGFKELEHKAKPAASIMPKGSVCCSNTSEVSSVGRHRLRAAKLCALHERGRPMTISRRALLAALLDRHFGNGAPTWRVGRGKPSERPCDTFADADDQRDQLITKLNWLGKHNDLPVAERLGESSAAEAAPSAARVPPARSACAPSSVSASRLALNWTEGSGGCHEVDLRRAALRPGPRRALQHLKLPRIPTRMKRDLAAAGLDWYFLALDASFDHVRGNPESGHWQLHWWGVVEDASGRIDVLKQHIDASGAVG